MKRYEECVGPGNCHDTRGGQLRHGLRRSEMRLATPRQQPRLPCLPLRSTEVSTATAGTVVVQNGTFTGPGCPSRPAQVFMALRIPCLHYTNSSTWNASLLKYNGKDFYAATETVGLLNSSIATTYTVWFDNSTEYCVSPYLSVSELPTCPTTIRDFSGGGAMNPLSLRWYSFL